MNWLDRSDFFTCHACGKITRIDYKAAKVPDTWIYRGRRKWLDCPGCGTRTWNRKQLNARHSDAPCSDACQNAIGTTCRCACGGANHGAAWLYDPKSAVKRGVAA